MANSKISDSQKTDKVKSNAKSMFDSKTSNEILQAFGNVEFGMLSHKCKNFGICRIEEINGSDFNLGSQYEGRKSGAQAILSLYPEGQVELAFTKASLRETTIKVYFRDNKFVVGEDYIFSPKSSSRLSRFMVKKGSYYVVETLGFLVVTFDT